jgi:hypothetical protein
MASILRLLYHPLSILFGLRSGPARTWSCFRFCAKLDSREALVWEILESVLENDPQNQIVLKYYENGEMGEKRIELAQSIS